MPIEKQIDGDKRSSLNTLVWSVASFGIANTWHPPIVDSLILPAHAQTSAQRLRLSSMLITVDDPRAIADSRLFNCDSSFDVSQLTCIVTAVVGGETIPVTTVTGTLVLPIPDDVELAVADTLSISIQCSYAGAVLTLQIPQSIIQVVAEGVYDPRGCI